MAIQTRVEEPQGNGFFPLSPGDNTALNDVEFTCFRKRDQMLQQEIAPNAIDA
jgi:hypothetical protein